MKVKQHICPKVAKKNKITIFSSQDHLLLLISMFLILYYYNFILSDTLLDQVVLL